MQKLHDKLQKLVTGPIYFEGERIYRLFTGGLLYEQLINLNNPKDDHYPEVWFASTIEAANVRPPHLKNLPYPEGLSKITVDGQVVLFRDLVKEFPEAMIGAKVKKEHGATVPLVAKFLDAAVRSVIQCHPNSSFTQRYFNYPSGKNEAWVILGLRENIQPFPHLHLGFKSGITREKFAPVMRRGDTAELHNCMHQIPISVGETYFVPAGTIHALGPGLLAIEIQEPADFTFRAETHWLDMNLPEERRHLGLGFDAMEEAFSYEALSLEENIAKYRFLPRTLLNKPELRIDELLPGKPSHPFGIVKLTINGRAQVVLGNEFSIGLITRGQGSIGWSGGEMLLQAGRGLFFPAALMEAEIRADDCLEIVLCYLDKFLA